MTSFWKRNLFILLPHLTVATFAFLVMAPASLGASSFAQTSYEVLSPYTFKDASNKKYKLYGIYALDKKEDKNKYIATQKTISEFIKTPVSLQIIGDEPNRYGFYDVILWNENKSISLQEILLEKGLSKINITDKTLSRKIFERWKDAENKSAFNGYFSIKTNTTVKPYQFQIVEDTILSVSERKSFTFINFGQDWKDDFTIMIPKAVWKKLDQSRFTSGQSIRIRGFTENYYGAMIKLESDRQLD